MHYESHRGNNMGKPNFKLSHVIPINTLRQIYKSSEYGRYKMIKEGYIFKLVGSTGGFREYVDCEIVDTFPLKHDLYFNDEDILLSVEWCLITPLPM